jgi:hypothetical protein
MNYLVCIAERCKNNDKHIITPPVSNTKDALLADDLLQNASALSILC